MKLTDTQRMEQSICGRARGRKPPNERERARPGCNGRGAVLLYGSAELFIAGKSQKRLTFQPLCGIAECHRKHTSRVGSIYARAREAKLLHLCDQSCALYTKLRAAPFEPPTIHPWSSSVRRIRSRSISFRVDGGREVDRSPVSGNRQRVWEARRRSRESRHARSGFAVREYCLANGRT